MNILVTAANGQLGNEIILVSKGSSHHNLFTDVMDASEESVAMLKKLAGEDVNIKTEYLDLNKS